MFTEFVHRIHRISKIRKVMARQHVTPDGLLTRYENLTPDLKSYLTAKENPEDSDYVPSTYFLDDYHLDVF